MDPDCQIALSENLKKFQPYVFFFKFLPPRSWSSIWIGTNYQGGSNQASLPNLSQYFGGKLFLNLHLNFPIWLYLQFLGQTNWSLELPPPLRSFLLTRSKRQRLLQSNLGQNLQYSHHKCMRFSTIRELARPGQECFGHKDREEEGGYSAGVTNNDQRVRIWRRKLEAGGKTAPFLVRPDLLSFPL